MEEIPKIPNLTFGNLLGRGHFSHVYKGTFENKIPVAIKVIERGSEKSISLEVDLLSSLSKISGVVNLLHIFQADNTILVFEFLKSISLDDFYLSVTLPKLRVILYQLISAVAECHKLNIVHRDLKFGNISISPNLDTVKILDWGCGSKIYDSMSCKAGSRSCRSPEMLLGFRQYSSYCDCWAIGVFILGILGKGKIPWRANQSNSAIISLSNYFGGDEICSYAESLGLALENLNGMTSEPTYSISSNFSSEMSFLFSPKLIDLMMKFLTLDYRNRLTAADALKHPFFLD